jgi:hypothetical protein
MQQGTAKHQITRLSGNGKKSKWTKLVFNPKLHLHAHFARNTKSYSYNLVQYNEMPFKTFDIIGFKHKDKQDYVVFGVNISTIGHLKSNAPRIRGWENMVWINWKPRYFKWSSTSFKIKWWVTNHNLEVTMECKIHLPIEQKLDALLMAHMCHKLGHI